MGLFDSDEVKRKREHERRTKLAEEQRRKKVEAKNRIRAVKKKEAKLERLKEISSSYENGSPYSMDSQGSSPQGNKNTPPMSLNRGLGSSSASYNKDAFSKTINDSGSSKGAAEQAFPKLNRW